MLNKPASELLEGFADALEIRGANTFRVRAFRNAARRIDTLTVDINELIESDEIETIPYGDIGDFTNFMGAVIDKVTFDKLQGYIDRARTDSDADVLCGGMCDDSIGYFISPTIIQAHNPRYVTMETELFGPVLTVYVYKDQEYEQALELCDRTSPYALTGAIFGTDRAAINLASDRLRHAAGNFYINDKPTGAVVGQQPFGGARASGTNDKAGSSLNLLRWVSARTTKETFTPARDYRYPHMQEP